MGREEWQSLIPARHRRGERYVNYPKLDALGERCYDFVSFSHKRLAIISVVLLRKLLQFMLKLSEHCVSRKS
jgi:hypothetical protein